MRRSIAIAHRWLGLSLGLMFAFLGLTGSLLVFDHAIDANILNRDLWQVEARDGKILTVGQAVDRLVAQRPDMTDQAIQARPSSDRAFWGRYTRHTPGGDETWIVVVDPYDGWIRGEYAYGKFPISRRNALTIIYELHRTLLSGHVGEIIVGVTGIFLLLSIILGYVTWWPRGGKWRVALTYKTGAAARRKLYDWHKLSGAYAGVILLATVFAGIYLSLPKEFTAVVHWFAETKQVVVSNQSVIVDRPRISGREAEQLARGFFPEAEIKSMFAPEDAQDTFTVIIRQEGEPRRSGGATIVYVDQYSGAARGIIDSRKSPSGSQFLEWLFPIHNGEIAGLAGRILLVAVGLIPSVLIFTGFTLWRRRRAARLLSDARARLGTGLSISNTEPST